MTTETRQRIRAYKKALPELRERVIAVALLLAMSVSMLASASFAWLTISRRPELTGVSTTVAANGNLEIALATGTVNTTKAPGESQIGDSSAADGQSVTASNITWGNLINLSDPSYGLDNLTLRPAQLNQSSLLINPLFGAEYKKDGRIEKLNSDFGYAIWDATKERFMISDGVGVRAISSTTTEAVGFAQDVAEKRGDAEAANLLAGSMYIDITKDSNYMNTLASIMGTYMTANLNDSNPDVSQKDVQNLRDLFSDFIAVYDQQFLALTKLANYQLFLLNNSEEGATPYDDKTVEQIKAATEAELKAENIRLSGLNTAKSDYKKLQEGYEDLKVLAEQGSVKFGDSGLEDIVNNLMNTGACTLDGTPVSSIGMSNATNYLDGKTHNAVITNGVLYNFEKLNGARCNVKELKVSATMIITVSIKANITTNAPQRAQFIADMEDYADKLNKGTKPDQVANDTYGLAIDLWVRTNASGSYLTLEGNILTTSETVQATGTDLNGNTVNLYTLTREAEEEDGTKTQYSIDLYQVTDEAEGTTTWYNATTHGQETLSDGENPILKMVEVVTVVGYEGENRIWEDNSQMSLDATTQGSGSCYVYYADSPEDQARSLELLKAMNVAFVDDEGSLLATAIMDTERYYAENGRVTVPLVLSADSAIVGTDELFEPIYGITPLEKNVAKRITAIVYLDGTRLGNEDVLAASDIQGKLNIQFGSSMVLSHAKDEALMVATRSVSATADPVEFKYDESLDSGTPMTTYVTLNVDGDKPNSVTGFFIRAISSTQGSREQTMIFEPQADGTWVAEYTFTAPGVYKLRSVELDGQTYDLSNPPEIKVEGFTVKSLTQAGGGTHVNILTAAASSSVSLDLEFASDKAEAMPSTVQGRYLRTDGTAVNVDFVYNVTTNKWTGTANFISSGEYTLKYLVLDGEYTELDSGMWKTASVKLGMKTEVYTASPTSFKYVPDEMTDAQKNLKMQVMILDNAGKPLEGRTGAYLYYLMEGSALAENGMEAPLTWNGATGYYECTFESKVGVFKFSRVTVDGNTITYAADPPVFRIMSPNPPVYTGYVPLAYRYQAEPTITMDVKMSYSSTATVAAVIRNLDNDKTYEVQGTKAKDENNVQTWSFLIPVTEGEQNGNWQMETIKVWNFYDADGNYIEAEVDANGKLTADTGENRDAPLEFAVDGHITKAVTEVYVTVNLPQGFDHHLGNSATSGDGVTIATATDGFLTVQSAEVPTVTILDFENQPVGIANDDGTFTSYVSNVGYSYAYTGDSQSHGGYTGAAVAQQTATPVTVTLTNSGDNKTFTPSGNITLTYAGTYTPTLKYTINNVAYTKSATAMGTSAPMLEVWSKAPTATITAISPTGSNATKITYTTKSLSWGRGTEPTFTAGTMLTSSFDQQTNEATVYAVATADNSTQRHGSFTRPTMTVTIAGVDSGCTVSFTLPAGSADAITFTRTGNGTINNTLGKVSQIKSWTSNFVLTHTLDAYYGHGSQTITTMTVVKDNVTYTVTLPKPIVVNNPNSVNQ